MKRVALYARLSIATDESVSIERQLAAGRKLADAMGYKVVLEAVDDGVSASTNKPEHRLGWRSILTSAESFDLVIIWKIDRLARSVLDFLNANEALEKRGAAIKAVEDPIDMSSDMGKMIAVILAVFAEMEAKAIGARVKAAHLQLKKDGRIPSGRTPYGYKSIPNPDGPGKIIAIDEERIPFVIEAVRRASNGETLYSIAQYMESAGAPRRENKLRKHDSIWSNTSVEGFLYSPRLAGMTPYNPGRKRGNFELPDVLRGDDGMPIVDESAAIMTPAEWYAMHETLKQRKYPGRLQANNNHLLAGLARCTCNGPLHKTGKGAEYLRCTNSNCQSRSVIKRSTLEDHVVESVKAKVGNVQIMERIVDADAEQLKVADIQGQIRETTERMAYDDDIAPLVERLNALKLALKSLSNTPAEIRVVRTGKTVADALAGDMIEARSALIGLLDKVVVKRPAKRGQFNPERVELVWAKPPTV